MCQLAPALLTMIAWNGLGAQQRTAIAVRAGTTSGEARWERAGIITAPIPMSKSNATLLGVLIGATLGGVAGYYYISETCDACDDAAPLWAGAAIGAVIGGLFGGVSGAAHAGDDPANARYQLKPPYLDTFTASRLGQYTGQPTKAAAQQTPNRCSATTLTRACTSRTPN
jgi:hypothetical protein